MSKEREAYENWFNGAEPTKRTDIDAWMACAAIKDSHYQPLLEQAREAFGEVLRLLPVILPDELCEAVENASETLEAINAATGEK